MKWIEELKAWREYVHCAIWAIRDHYLYRQNEVRQSARKAKRNFETDALLSRFDWTRVVTAVDEVKDIGCLVCREEKFGFPAEHHSDWCMSLCSKHLLERERTDLRMREYSR